MNRTTLSQRAFILGISLLFTASASFGVVVYQQTPASGFTTSTATNPIALDDVTFAVGSTLVRQQLSALTFGVGVLPNTIAQSAVVFIDFYDLVNPASPGAVESNYIGGFGGTLTITANTSTTTTALRAFTFNSLTGLSTPIFFNDDNIGIVITLTNAAGTSYSTILTPLMASPGTPTIGTSVTGVYRDTSGDGDFQAAELNPALGNLYLSITTVSAPIPEPMSFAMIGLGAAGLLVWYRKIKSTV